MKYLLQLEEAALLTLGLGGLYYQPVSFSAWAWPLLFLSPDLGMLGYLIGPKAGAWTYNLLHHRAIAVALLAIGFLAHLPLVQLAGLIIFTHSAFDRALGYGLKLFKGFSYTHLGRIGAGTNALNRNP
jgi:xanthosine utilization system XapX-like protein